MHQARAAATEAPCRRWADLPAVPPADRSGAGLSVPQHWSFGIKRREIHRALSAIGEQLEESYEAKDVCRREHAKAVKALDRLWSVLEKRLCEEWGAKVGRKDYYRGED